MELHLWLICATSFALYSVAPGPATLLTMHHSGTMGVKRANQTIFGLELGLMLQFLVVGAGLGSLLSTSETAFMLVKVVGSCYLIYCGIQQVIARFDSADGAAQGSASVKRKKLLMTGLLTNATNPKGLLFMAAVVPQFLRPEAHLLEQLVVIVATMIVIDAFILNCYAWTASFLQAVLKVPGLATIQCRVFGTLFIFAGGTLLFLQHGA